MNDDINSYLIAIRELDKQLDASESQREKLERKLEAAEQEIARLKAELREAR